MNPEVNPPQTPSDQQGPVNSQPPSNNPPVQSTPVTPPQYEQPASPVQPAVSASAYGAQSPQTPGLSTPRKGLLIAVAAVVALAVVGGVSAVSLHHASKPAAKAAQPAAVSATEKPTATPASSGAKQTIPVSQTITDDTMGLTIKVNSVDIGKVAIPNKYKDANSDKTVVIADVNIASAGKYSLSLGSTQLDMIDASGQSDTSTSLSDNDLKALGLPVLADQTSETSVAGNVAFWVPTSDLGKLTLRYTRQSAGVIGSKQTISEKTYDVVIR